MASTAAAGVGSGVTSAAPRPPIAVGMEAFRRQDQAFLDQYVQNPNYSLAQLASDTSYQTEWGYDLLHYVPVLSYAKEKGIRLIGLNAPTQVRTPSLPLCQP